MYPGLLRFEWLHRLDPLREVPGFPVSKRSDHRSPPAWKRLSPFLSSNFSIHRSTDCSELANLHLHGKKISGRGCAGWSEGDLLLFTGTGEFTKEAIRWSEGQPIELINGPALLQRLSGVESAPLTSPAPETPMARTKTESRPLPKPSTESKLSTGTEKCPKCGEALVLRTARRGPNAGKAFMGCSGYPRCRFTRPV